MGKNAKTLFRNFDYLHCDDFAKFLSDMAAKGWHFKEWGAGLKFEKGEPEAVIYAVEVFTGASENDLRPEPKTKEFAEYCEAAGWEFVDAKMKFCIFKKIDANAVPILTDEERVNNAVKGLLPTSLILFPLYLLNAILQWSNLLGPFFDNRIFSTMGWINVGIWTGLSIMEGTKLFHALWCKWNSKRKIKRGEKVYLGNAQGGRFYMSRKNIFSWILILLMGILYYLSGEMAMFYLWIALLVVMFVYGFIMGKLRPDSVINIVAQVGLTFLILIMSIVFGFSSYEKEKAEKLAKEPPLVISDYSSEVSETTAVQSYIDKNILGSSEKYFVYHGEKVIYYQVYRSDIDWIMERIWAEEIDVKRNETITDATAEWEAKKAFYNKVGEYFVQYEDSIVIFDHYEEVPLSQEEINIIREKLGVR